MLNSLSSFIRSFISNSKTGNVYIFEMCIIQCFTSQILGVVSLLGKKNIDFFSHLGFEIQRISDLETRKPKLYSVRALKHYLNEKNLIHNQVTATFSKFSAQIFETYFSLPN